MILATCLAVGACTSTAKIAAPTQSPVDVEERIVIEGEVIPLPEESSIEIQRLPPAETVSAAVQQLLASAERLNSAGDSEAAADLLERALRIEPRNALLWSRLANVRFALNEWWQSIQLATKSNTLAGNNTPLLRQNWYLMVNAYTALGDLQAVKKYQNMLNQ